MPDIKDAAHFWIEAGAMSGPPAHRHQVEFANDVAEFFDEYSRESETLPLRLKGGSVLWRPLTYRGTDYGQWTDIWRLGLLTPAMGGPVYAGRILHFSRDVAQTPDGWVMCYELQVANVGSSDAVTWATASAPPSGDKAVTGGPEGREFGWYV